MFHWSFVRIRNCFLEMSLSFLLNVISVSNLSFLLSRPNFTTKFSLKFFSVWLSIWKEFFEIFILDPTLKSPHSSSLTSIDGKHQRMLKHDFALQNNEGVQFERDYFWGLTTILYRGRLAVFHFFHVFGCFLGFYLLFLLHIFRFCFFFIDFWFFWGEWEIIN